MLIMRNFTRTAANIVYLHVIKLQVCSTENESCEFSDFGIKFFIGVDNRCGYGLVKDNREVISFSGFFKIIFSFQC